MKRREFLFVTTQWALLPLGVSLLEACGGSGGGYGGGSGGNTSQGGHCTTSGTIVSIQVVHNPNHTLTIPAADVVAGTEKTYTLSDNGSGHAHNVTITAADFAMLQNNNGVMEVSTLSAGHTHNVTVNCA
ncbi:hypothetical protein [Bdellovibrio sp. HCB-162]|uniref:hypothetical protein n=1 Tax=Bdellovibrio sp. HCB-162 TaxID=3394234 RepID=UPI0039BC8F71